MTLPPDVRRLVYLHVRSPLHLELLLLMRRLAPAAATAQELAGKTGVAQPVLERTLFDLMAGGLLAAARALPIAYRYSPKPPELTRTVDKLAELYQENPLVVANLILDREAESLRLFSDAFRLRDGK